MPAVTPKGPQVKIRALRQAHGLTLEQLAERMAEHGAPIHADSISNIENGRKRASDRVLIAWAKALGINPLDVWQTREDLTDARVSA